MLVRLKSCSSRRAFHYSAAGDFRTLYQRISSLGTQNGKVGSTINQYVHEAPKELTKETLHQCIRKLRRFRNYHLALEVIEWMDSRFNVKDSKDYPTCLDLIGKVKGIEEAEKFFHMLSRRKKNIGTYGALLNLYCTQMMEDKAWALFNKMEEKFEVTSLSFNCIISMYMRLGKPEKVTPLVKDMKRRNLELSTYTYNIWMTSYLHLDDVKGAVRVFKEIRREYKCDWTTFSNLAVIYVKSGMRVEAEVALKRLEQVMRPKNREAYHYLLSLYAGTSNLDEVHRVWKSMKSEFETITNTSYGIMFKALGKLDDIVGLKNCYEEWESGCHNYDNKIVRSVIKDFLRHDMFDDSQIVFRHVVERSRPPYFKIFETFMAYHLRNNQVEQALLGLNDAASQVEESGWKPNSEMIKDFLTAFEEKKDVRSAEEFCKILKKLNCLESFVYSSLLKTYMASGQTADDLRERIKDDGIVIDAYMRYLLEKVCPE